MAGEWTTISLDELYEFRSGLSKPRSAFGSGYPFLSFKDVFYNTFVPRQLSGLVNSTPEERHKCSIKRGDIFLTRTSETMEELGMSCVALRDVPDGTFNGFTKRLRPKPTGTVVPEYAGYFFRSPAFRREVTAMSALSTRASLNNEMLARLSLVLPSIEEQRAIAHILGTLDDKIELNRRMNETLEAMARALFKSWFVDFDPVRAKAEGRAPGLPKPIADLFPDRLVDSEFGEIPAGWEVETCLQSCQRNRLRCRPTSAWSKLARQSGGHARATRRSTPALLAGGSRRGRHTGPSNSSLDEHRQPVLAQLSARRSARRQACRARHRSLERGCGCLRSSRSPLAFETRWVLRSDANRSNHVGQDSEGIPRSRA